MHCDPLCWSCDAAVFRFTGPAYGWLTRAAVRMLSSP
jgi:hypothetical protein